MDSLSLKNLIDLINEVGEQDDAVDIHIGMEHLHTSFDDLGIDSLAFLSVVAQLESRYGIRIGFAEASAANNPAELYDMVSRHLDTV